MDFKNKSVLVYDYGLFLELAIRLSKEFGKVYYYTPWKGSYPTSEKSMIGRGLDEVERVDQFWQYVDKVDLICFFDIYNGDLQNFLREKGYRVFGSGRGEIMELDRWKFKETLVNINLPVAKTVKIIGLDNLRDYLKTVNNKWLKISKYRGDMESYHHEEYSHTLPWIDDLSSRMGSRREVAEVLVEDNITGDCETGYDGFVADGEYSSHGTYGYEVKDEGYIAKVEQYAKMPKHIKTVNDKFSPVLKELGYRGMYSTELRITPDNKAYYIDFCARAGSPPSELISELYHNFAEIVWDTAGGKGAICKPTAKYGAEILLHSTWLKTKWTAVDFPSEHRQWIKFRNLTKMKGQHYLIPQDGVGTIGAVVGIGNTLKEAMERAKSVIEGIKCYDLAYDKDVFDTADEYMCRGDKMGVKF